eukprot:scaffold20723_cov67-Isochrysis_galbana.AAC.2
MGTLIPGGGRPAPRSAASASRHCGSGRERGTRPMQKRREGMGASGPPNALESKPSSSSQLEDTGRG